MVNKRKYWKSYAKKKLKGNWSLAIWGMVAGTAINLIGNILSPMLFSGENILDVIFSELFIFVVSLIAMVFSTGYVHMQLNICRGRKYGLKDLLYAFRNGPDRILIAAFAVALLNLVGQIPFYYVVYAVEPADTMEGFILWCEILLASWALSLALSVILTVPFALAFYLLADDAEMGGLEALKTSARLMKGNVCKFLLLELSFVPLMLLSVFSFYLGLLWLLPYMEFTETAFYLYVTGELEQQRREEYWMDEIAETGYIQAGNDYNSEA